MTERILITICARGGSKGIPGKNVKLLNGQPLIYYSLKIAAEFRNVYLNTSIVLSTDSQEIRGVVETLDIENVDMDYVRPDILASDHAGKLDVITDVKSYFELRDSCTFDYVIDLDVTSPLRSIEDLEMAMEKLKSDAGALNIFSVSPSNRNPYFNMVEQAEDGYYRLCKQGFFLTRQSAPDVFDLNASFYIYKEAFFQSKRKSVINDKSIIYSVPHICFDLDHPIDFEFMSFLIEKDKLDFNFIR